MRASVEDLSKDPDSTAEKRLGTDNHPIVSLGILYLCWGVVVAGLTFGNEFMVGPQSSESASYSWFQTFGARDGFWYQRIAAYGYDYDPDKQSSVVFFPLFPLLGGTIRAITGLSALPALLIVSWSAYVAAGLALIRYVRGSADPRFAQQVLLCFCLWPMGLFFRVAYTESLFVLLMILAATGLQQRWPLIVIALLAGAASGTRTVGIALLPPLLWEIWRRTPTWQQTILRFLVIAPVAVWGLLGYMIYLQITFGDPLVFASNQERWSVRPELPLLDRVTSLVTLRPIWSLYLPGSEAAVELSDRTDNLLFSLNRWNGIYFVGCTAIIAYGIRKKMLTTHEWMLSAGLLLVPYVLQAHRMVMISQGRFTCVVFPLFLVLGRLIAQCPNAVGNLLFALMGIQLFYWSALFAAGYYVF